MICQRCQKFLRSCEGIKCDMCESRFHIKCIGGNPKKFDLECGDRKYYWTCATCQKPVSKNDAESIKIETITNAINTLMEKFEVVNKIQLPKLNNDLLLIKSVTDRIITQNQNILLKLEELKAKQCADQLKNNSKNKYQKRNVNLSPRPNRHDEKPLILSPDKIVRYRTRRRSYPVIKMLLQLNRKLNHGRSQKRKTN
ncbi:uncharacterized protein LOC123668833 [Melitaea cinxia]|uniref:uncharacterized protein LOC123668833 n=1 Tax=Melitaea cinxia TaxID=113334 RepID=UPI001E2743BC|nr:uncharacterized protein LOC123668833 [Melitaea cinxia]